MDSYTENEAQLHFKSLLNKVLNERRHTRITSDEGAVVLLPEETYQNLAVTLELLSTPGLLESLQFSAEAAEAVS